MPNPMSQSYDELLTMQTEQSPKTVKATNSTTGIIRTQAGVFGIMHPHKKSLPLSEPLLPPNMSRTAC